MAASPSAFSIPSTPINHQQSQQQSTPTSNSRHLKRLSLGGSAFSSSSSPASSPTTPRSTPGSATRGGGHGHGHGQRNLRLSVSNSGGGGVGYAPPTSSSAEDQSSPSTSRTSATWSFPAPSSSSSCPSTPLSARSLNRTSSTGGGGGHSRRMSSISYATSSREAGEGVGSPSPTAMRRQGLGVTSPGGLRSISPIGKRGEREGEGEGEEQGGGGGGGEGGEPRQLVREREGGRTSPVVGRRSVDGGSGSPVLSRGGGGGGNQPTLTEANADLLSFIAKKERKCLDLREELKRHEEELKSLKKKWEAIVAKSLISSSPPTTTSMPRLSSPDVKRSAAAHASTHSTTSVSSTSTTSPHTSPTPPRHAPLHSLDFSLLSSTFDPSHASDLGLGTPEIELPESVQAAKAWMGGMFGKVMDAVGVVEESLTPTHELERRLGLGMLKEEVEEEEEEQEGGSASSVEEKGRRASSASGGSSSSFGFGFLGGGGSAGAAAGAVEPSEGEREEGTTPTPSSPVPGSSRAPVASTTSDRRPSSSSTSSSTSTSTSGSVTPSDPDLILRSPDLQSRRSAFTGPPPVVSAPRRPLPSHDVGHARTRSTFDVLGGGWGALGKKWTAVTESETFRNSKRTTFGLLDTFEQGLATALGPLEPPPLSPIEGEREREREREREGRKTTPRQGDEFDWAAFGEADGEGEKVVAPPLASSKVGRYRRPSLTPRSSMPALAPKSPQLVPTPAPPAREKAREQVGEGEKPKVEQNQSPDARVLDSWATW